MIAQGCELDCDQRQESMMSSVSQPIYVQLAVMFDNVTGALSLGPQSTAIDLVAKALWGVGCTFSFCQVMNGRSSKQQFVVGQHCHTRLHKSSFQRGNVTSQFANVYLLRSHKFAAYQHNLLSLHLQLSRNRVTSVGRKNCIQDHLVNMICLWRVSACA